MILKYFLILFSKPGKGIKSDMLLIGKRKTFSTELILIR